MKQTQITLASNWTLAADSADTIEYSLSGTSLEGKTILGIVGNVLDGSGISRVFCYYANFSQTTITVSFRNTNTSSSATLSPAVRVLYRE